MKLSAIANKDKAQSFATRIAPCYLHVTIISTDENVPSPYFAAASVFTGT